jgi:hypothetical protein
MLFLGAGASKPFNIPTLVELSQDVTIRLKELGHTDVIERIQLALNEFNIQMDFESLYCILEGLVDTQRSVKAAGPLVAYLVGKKELLPKNYDYSGMLNDLRKTIYSACAIDSTKFNEVKRCYEGLFQGIEKNTSSERLIGANSESVNIGKVICATNYDMSLEMYFYAKNLQFNDGFVDDGGFVKYFNPNKQMNPYAQDKKAIIKLHGSIFQFFNGDQAIKTKVDPTSEALPFKLPVGKEMMIYPTTQKDILSNPYFSFFTTFKNIRWSKLLVIGYSFRDRYVNDAILENLKYTDPSQLIVIDPDVDKVLENLYANTSVSNWKIPKHRLYTFSGKFGTLEVCKYLSRIEHVSDNQDTTFDPSVIRKLPS